MDRRIEEARIVKVEHVEELAFSSGDEISEMLEAVKKQNRGRPKKVAEEVKDLSSKKNKWKKAERNLMR